MRKRPSSVSIRRLAMVAGVLLLPGCGGAPSKLEFHSDQPGNFRVLVAGKAEPSKQTVASPAGQLEMTSMESIDGDRIRRVVTYTDLPPAIVGASDPDALLDGGIRKMSGGATWTVQGQAPIALDGHPGREVRFAVSSPSAPEKGSGRARIFLVGNRLYQAIMVGPASKITEEELDHFVKSFELLQKVPAIASTTPAPADTPAVAAQPVAGRPPAQPERPAPAAPPTVVAQQDPEPETAPPPARPQRPAPTRNPVRRPARPAPRAPAQSEDRVVQVGDEGPDFLKPAEVPIEVSQPGGYLGAIPEPNGNPREQFREATPQRGVLVGFRVGYVEIFGGPKVAMVEPIFQVGNRYIPGKRHGKPVRPAQTVVAKPGYAVGAIHTRTGLTVDAFQVEFMRFKDGQLDPDDSYMTNWLGDPRGGSPRYCSGEGKLIVGIHGRSNGREINALGLLVAE
jgi:hypothetical protein